VYRQQRRYQREEDAQKLVGKVEPGPPRRLRGVEGGRLLCQRLSRGQLGDQRDGRVHRRGAQRDAEDEQRLVAQHPAVHRYPAHVHLLHLHTDTVDGGLIEQVFDPIDPTEEPN
jgi:hypothetical protein